MGSAKIPSKDSLKQPADASRQGRFRDKPVRGAICRCLYRRFLPKLQHRQLLSRSGCRRHKRPYAFNHLELLYARIQYKQEFRDISRGRRLRYRFPLALGWVGRTALLSMMVRVVLHHHLHAVQLLRHNHAGMVVREREWRKRQEQVRGLFQILVNAVG